MAKQFHISDVLSVTTGRLVSSRHIQGVYDVLNFLTGDSLFTHQLSRASRECEPWLKTQFPQLFPDDPKLKLFLDALDGKLANREDKAAAVAEWVEGVRGMFELPEMLTVYEMGADMHTHIDPIEEWSAVVGDKKIIVITKD